MTQNEEKTAKWIQVKNLVLVVGSVCLVLGLFYMSKSWVSLTGMFPLFFMTRISVD